LSKLKATIYESHQENKRRLLQLTNQPAFQVAMIEIACRHKIFQLTPMQLSKMLALRLSTLSIKSM